MITNSEKEEQLYTLDYEKSELMKRKESIANSIIDNGDSLISLCDDSYSINLVIDELKEIIIELDHISGELHEIEEEIEDVKMGIKVNYSINDKIRKNIL